MNRGDTSEEELALSRESKRLKMAEWRAKNPEKVREQNRLSYERHREKEIERVRSRRAADPEASREYTRKSVARWRENNPGKAFAATKRYREKNPEKAKEIAARQGRKRRARLAGVRSENYTTTEIAERDGWVCHLCGGMVDSGHATIDHRIPISKGGDDTRDNVSLAHGRCNSRRHTKPLPETGYFFDQPLF